MERTLNEEIYDEFLRFLSVLKCGDVILQLVTE